MIISRLTHFAAIHLEMVFVDQSLVRIIIRSTTAAVGHLIPVHAAFLGHCQLVVGRAVGARHGPGLSFDANHLVGHLHGTCDE